MRGLKRLGLGMLALLVFASVLPYLLPMPDRGLPPRKSPYLDGRFAEVCGQRWHFQRWQPADTSSARARVLLIHRWRRIVLRYPDLPAELMPLDSPLADPRRAVAEAYARIAPAAEAWLDSAEDSGPAMPIPRKPLFARFGGPDRA